MEHTLKAALGQQVRETSLLDQTALDDFDSVVVAHQRRVYRVLLGLLRDPDAAETLTQECFLRAYQARSSFRGEASIGTWLIRIAVNLARDYGRSRRTAFWRRLFASDPEEVALAEQNLPGRQASAEQQMLAREELQAVWSAVETLSGQQRAVFVLRFVEELTLEEIAQATSLSVGTIKSHLARAVSAVRRKVRGTEATAALVSGSR
ncbi:MAG TPA: sigma-70 family RNA polymerase sigma factor [Terriglobales bacterium]|nr:sigma-70 family RNA polymerase sigma factor [Terriglobales bacterium]